MLARLRDQGAAVRRIVERIAGLEAGERELALRQLLVLAGLRRLEESVQQEARKVPILIDILENKVLGPAFQRGLEEGRQEGRQEGIQQGRQEGRQEGELELLRRMIKKRFGRVPPALEERLAKLPAGELEALGEKLLDAASLEDLLG